MPPVIDAAEGFEHGDALSSAAAPSGVAVYQAINNSAVITYPAGRLGGKCIRITEDGVTAANVREDWPVTQHRVFHKRFKLPTGAPSVDRSTGLLIEDGTGALMLSMTVRSAANGGLIELQPGTGTRQQGPDVTDGAWHTLEAEVDTSGTTWTLRWRVDGVAMTDATQGSHVATNSTRVVWGTAINSHTLDIEWDDCIGSATQADYPLSQYISAGNDVVIQGKNPNGQGTNVLGSSNPIVDDGGGNTNLYQRIDDWASGVADTSTYITYTSTTTGDAASNYAEMTLEDLDAAAADVWGVVGDAAVHAAGTGTDAVTVRVVDSGGSTLTNIVSGDVSEGTLRFLRAFITAPGAGWLAGFNGCKIRVGFSTDTNALPRVSAVMLQVVTVIANGQTVTATSLVDMSLTLFAPKANRSFGPALLDLSMQTFAPAIGRNVAAPLVDMSLQLFGFSMAGATSITTPLVDMSLTLLAPAAIRRPRIHNNFDGVADGAAITSGNSGGASGDAFDQVNLGGPSTFTASAAEAIHGARAAVMDVGPGNVAYAQYNEVTSELYGRIYVRFPTIPVATVVLALIRGSSVTRSWISVQTTGQVRMVDAAGNPILTTPNDVTGKLVAGSVARIEWHWIGNATTGFFELKLFLSPESSSPSSTITASNQNTGGAMDQLRIGQNTAQVTDLPAFILDELELSKIAYPGPYSVPTQTVTAGFVDMSLATLAPALTQFVGTSLLDMSLTLLPFGQGRVLPPMPLLAIGWGDMPWGEEWGGSGLMTFAPKVNMSVAAPLVDMSLQLFAPAVAPKSISAPLLNMTLLPLGPQLNLKVATPLIDMSLSLFIFALPHAQDVTPGLLDLSLTPLAPSVNPKIVETPLISFALLPLGPQITQSPTPPLLDMSLTPLAPSVGSLIPPLLDLSLTLLAPSLGERVTPPLLDLSLVVFVPGVGKILTFPLLDLSLTPLIPTVPVIFGMPLINLSLSTFPPSTFIGQVVLTWFLPPVRERVPHPWRLDWLAQQQLGGGVPRSPKYMRFLAYDVGVDVTIDGVLYQGGRWAGPLSDTEIDAITAAGYAGRLVTAAEVGQLPATVP